MKQILLLNYYIILFLFIAPSLGMQSQYNNPTKNYFSELKNTIYQHKTPCTATISVVLTLCCLYKIKEMIQNNKTLFISTILSHCLLIYLLYRYPKKHSLNNNAKEFSSENCDRQNNYNIKEKNVNRSIKDSVNQKESERLQLYNEIIKNYIYNNNNLSYLSYVLILTNENNQQNNNLMYKIKLKTEDNISYGEKLYIEYKGFTEFFLLNYCLKNNLIKNKQEINQENLVAQLKKIKSQNIEDAFTNYNSEEKINSLIEDSMKQLTNLMQ